MRRRSRTRRVLKWAGLAMTLLILTLWALSLYRWVQFTTDRRLLDVRNGHILIICAAPDRPGSRHAPPTWKSGPAQDVMCVMYATPSSIWRGTVGLVALSVESGEDEAVGAWVSCVIPFWVLFLPVAALTAVLWWRDRRYPAGHCQDCGYDLTGNVSGRCPECGTQVAKP